MISWMQGEIVDTWQQGHKRGIVLSCQGIGYEIQLAEHHLPMLNKITNCVLWIHQIQKDDATSLFGFAEKKERDFFRILLGVNGIGPQVAIALLESCNIQELVTAIIDNNLEKLCSAQGVGKRTAERLTVELREKLNDFSKNLEPVSLSDRRIINSNQLSTESLKDLLSTLEALGYNKKEASESISAVAEIDSTSPLYDRGNPLSPSDTDAWLKATLIWLSQKAA